MAVFWPLSAHLEARRLRCRKESDHGSPPYLSAEQLEVVNEMFSDWLLVLARFKHEGKRGKVDRKMARDLLRMAGDLMRLMAERQQ